MFIGHYAVGLAAKRVAPKVSVGMFFLSVQFLDLIWPILLLLGFEHVLIEPGNTAYTPLNFIDYPFSHSLLASILWAIFRHPPIWNRRIDDWSWSCEPLDS